jgi:hypothetical protein
MNIVETLIEVRDATSVQLDLVMKEDNPRLQDAVDGMDISISKLDTVIEYLQNSPLQWQPLHEGE